MNNTGYFVFILLSLSFLIQACGSPSEEEILERERAVRDSLAQVQLDRQAAAERSQPVKEQDDSLAEVQQASLTEEVEADRRDHSPIQFDHTGRYTLQVESWRSEHRAEQAAEKWRNRGFDQAFVVKHGNDETGDVWFRIRLGRFDSYAMAQRQRENLKADFNISSWIDTAE